MNVYDEADMYCDAFNWSFDEVIDWLLGMFPDARSVFEPFCGNARYGPVFASRGLTYVGFDIAEAMLAKAPPAQAGVHVLRADARDFRIAELSADGFDLAWCPINSLSHLTRERDIVRHLQCVRRHLGADGRYVVELALVRHDGPWADPPGRTNEWSVPAADESVVHASWCRLRCDSAARTCTEQATFRRVRDGETIGELRQVFTMRTWSCEDLIRIAEEAGLTVENRAYPHEGFTPGSSIALSTDLENDGLNYFFILAPSV